MSLKLGDPLEDLITEQIYLPILDLQSPNQGHELEYLIDVLRSLQSVEN